MENKKMAAVGGGQKTLETSPKYKPDIGAAARFLGLLDPKALEFTFQTFNDSSRAKTKPGVLNGTLSDHFEELARLNQAGAGIFVTVNETDGKGRKKKDVTRVRAVFVDADGAPIEPILRASPHFLVNTSPGRWHAYWRVNDLPLDQFEEVQKGLIARFGTDSSVHDKPRVMRLPGFYHMKYDPFLVELVSEWGVV